MYDLFANVRLKHVCRDRRHCKPWWALQRGLRSWGTGVREDIYGPLCLLHFELRDCETALCVRVSVCMCACTYVFVRVHTSFTGLDQRLEPEANGLSPS